jgi:PPP family 3-phenylpropionic acid transporter
LVRSRDAAPFAGFYAALFFALGVFLPFWPVFLEHKGLDGAAIGTILGLGTWAKAAGNPLLGRLADRSARPRLVVVALAVVALAGTFAFPHLAGFWPLLIAYVVVFSAFQALIPIGDSRTLTVAADKGLDYGRLRLWGSAAFLAAVLGMGEVLDRAPASVIPWALALAFAALVGLAAALPAPRPATTTPGGRGVRTLIGDPSFVVFLVAVALLQASHAVYYAFSAVHWTTSGLSAATVGWLWAEGVIAEIGLFYIGARVVARLGPIGLLAAAAAGGLLRWTVLAGTTALPALIAVQGLHAMTFGAAHLGAMYFITRHAPRELQATAQGISAAATGGVGMGLAMLGAGPLYDAVAGRAFLAMAAMSLAALPLILWLARTTARGTASADALKGPGA